MIPAYDVFEDIAAALVVFAVAFYIVEAINTKLDNIVKHIYTMDMGKIVEKVCNDPLGFGSIKNTLRDARKIDSTITLNDIKQWKENNIEHKTQLKGYNSFVAKKPFEEFQIDLFFMPDDSQKYNVAMLMVDIFTTYTEATPLKDKTEGSLLSGLM